MAEILTALKALPQLILVINKLIEEVKKMHEKAVNDAVKKKLDLIQDQINQLKQAKTDEEYKKALDDLYNSIF